MSAAFTPAPNQGTPCGYCGDRSHVVLARRDKWACVACYLAHPASLHELAQRTRRALALVEVLLKVAADPVEARAMTDAGWELAAVAAKIGKPPSLETRQVVLQALEDSARRSGNEV